LNDPPPETLLYGRNAVREALRGRRRVLRLWGTKKELAGLGETVAAISATTREELDRLAGAYDHQGLVAEVEPYRYADAEHLLEREDALVLALDQIQDPGNLGAICRSAEVAGASGVVVPARGAAPVTGAVARASAGAVEHLPIARVTNLANYLRDAKQRGAWVYGAEAGAGEDYTSPDYGGRVVLVLGSEGKGLRPRVRDTCDALVALPVRGRIGSLNVSAATAVLLYEVLRQRQARGGS
jgi:23S rRNA (guanosine2251-2'-O)-methyltransferase